MISLYRAPGPVGLDDFEKPIFHHVTSREREGFIVPKEPRGTSSYFKFNKFWEVLKLWNGILMPGGRVSKTRE